MIIKEMPSYRALLEMAERYPDMDVLDCEAFLHVLRTGTILRRCSERHLGKLGYSSGQLMILCFLCQEPDPVPVCKLAQMAGVTTPSVSAVLAGMVRSGLVERLVDPSDKRVVRIGLTPKGQMVLDEVMPGLFERQAVAMSGLDEEELKTMVSLLSKVRLNSGRCSEESKK